jgi:hypothetical protein
MRDNLLFFNIPEHEKENTTEIIHDLLEQKIEIVQIEDVRKHVKIDRSHRIGRKREGKSCYPELKNAIAAGKQSRNVKDKLIIEGQVFNNTGQYLAI